MNDEFDGMVKQLGNALHTRVEQELAGRWNSLTLDARYDGDGGVLAKIRAKLPDREDVSIKTDNAIDLLLISLDGYRSVVGPEWYGVKLTISPAMDCTLDLNYDSECEQDESFFEN